MERKSDAHSFKLFHKHYTTIHKRGNLMLLFACRHHHTYITLLHNNQLRKTDIEKREQQNFTREKVESFLSVCNCMTSHTLHASTFKLYRINKTAVSDNSLTCTSQKSYSFWKKDRTRSVCTEKSCVSTKSCSEQADKVLHQTHSPHERQ